MTQSSATSFKMPSNDSNDPTGMSFTTSAATPTIPNTSTKKDGSAISAPPSTPTRFACLTRPDENHKMDGLRAWSVAFGGFLAGVALMGQIYSAGIFVVPLMNEYHSSLSATSLVATMTLVMFYVVGIFASHLSDYVGIRPVTITGMIIWNLGWILGSFAAELWESVLSQGILCGMGAAFVYWPVLSILPQWFRKYRATAMGVAVLGSGVGSIAISFGGQALINSLGWRDALRIIGGCGAFCLVFGVLLVDRRLPAKKHAKKGGAFRAVFSTSKEILAFTNARLFLASVFFFQFSFFIPYTYLASYSVSLMLPASFGGFALAMLGIGSAIGRVIFGPIADYFGRLRVYRINTLGAFVALACWPACLNESTILTFAFFYGAFGGGFAAMFAVVAADLWGPERLSGIFTLVNICAIPGAFAAGPLIGYIIGVAGYNAAIGVTAGMMGIALILVALVRKGKVPIQSPPTAPVSSSIPLIDSNHQSKIAGNDGELPPQATAEVEDLEASTIDQNESEVNMFHGHIVLPVPPEKQDEYYQELEQYNVDVEEFKRADEVEKEKYIRAIELSNFRQAFPDPPPAPDLYQKCLQALREHPMAYVREKVLDKFGSVPKEWDYHELGLV